MDHPKDNWANGEAYEQYVGRWSRLVARDFIHWLSVAPGSRWLDVGCGTGVLSQVILQETNPAHVKGIDFSEGFIAYAKANSSDPRLVFAFGDAQSLPEDTDSSDAAVAGLALNFIPRHDQVASELTRVVRTGGMVAAYVWDYSGKMELMRHFWDAAVALTPQARELDEWPRFPICQPEPLQNLFQTAGLQDVAVRAIDIPTFFADFDDYWSPFLRGQGPAPAYAMSLSEEHRTALRERIRAGIPFNPDGSIHLIARAWAVRGVK